MAFSNMILSSTAGSSCLFSALLTKCLEKNVFALCRLISRRNYAPRFVALLPQKEVLDEGKFQITSPGDARTAWGFPTSIICLANHFRLSLSFAKVCSNVYVSFRSGFHVIYLPYADDIRTLDPPQFPTASETQVDKMKEIISKLRFKYR